MKKYYINYDEKADINYCFIFALYIISGKDKKEHINNIIYYKSQKELANKIKEECNYNISVSTISRIINNNNYLPYFSIDKENNKIILNNCFKNGKAASNKFIILNEKEVYFLLQQDNKQLNKYYLYLKYYCGYSKTKSIDSTANQILIAIGYSNNCGNNKNNLSKYNKLLLDNGFINIQKIIDNKGHCRNIYTIKE